MATNILIVYYSMYGNCYHMAQAVAEGVRQVPDATPLVKRVPELIPDEKIAANDRLAAARDLQQDVPVATTEDLLAADGLVVGSPTRFGNMAAQMRNYWDQTTQLWLNGSLIGKPVGLFTSTASLHGGQETTLVSMMFTMIHHGMLIVGVPYSVPELITTEQGGTPYGPSHTAGPVGDIPLTEKEKTICRALGQRVAQTAAKLKG